MHDLNLVMIKVKYFYQFENLWLGLGFLRTGVHDTHPYAHLVQAINEFLSRGSCDLTML